jgi:chromosome segregation ATPase
MKLFLSIAAVVVIFGLAVTLAMTKRNDTAQLDTATGTIADFSNRLDSAQIRIAEREGSILALSNTLSNTLTECAATSLTLSNQLTEAESTNALQAEQITSLNRQLAAAASEKQALNQNLLDLTNQMAALTQRITLTETNLAQAGKDYAELEYRFLEDVAARTIVERRFNNLAEVQTQERKLQKIGAPWVTPESIYAGLNVEVKSNGVVHVLAPD